MDEETLRLRLVETFAKYAPKIVEPSEEIYKEWENALEAAIVEGLAYAIEESKDTFAIRHSIKYKVKTDIPFSQEEKHWNAYLPRIKHKLLQLGVPFVCYSTTELFFFVEDLKRFCDAEKMGLLL